MNKTDQFYEVSEIEIDKLIIERNTLDFKSKQITWLLNRIGASKGYTDSGQSSWDPANINWEPAEGTQGPYERSDDVDNPDFKAMLRDLTHLQGKLTRDGFFYWAFKNGTTIGRKQRKIREAQP